MESLLFRIFQESLTNCAKHAQPTSIAVALHNDGYPVELIITDDGIGFDPARLGLDGKIGLGLLNMREMAEVAGGTFRIESEPGAGTRVSIVIL